jgi:hypothetical protein
MKKSARSCRFRLRPSGKNSKPYVRLVRKF